MKNKIFQTNQDWSSLVIRVFLGLVIFPHGAQKLFGWFEGFGFAGTMQFFTESMGLPWLVGLIVILLESIGAIALVIGFGTRVFALGLAGLGLGIMVIGHWKFGFFMNWFGSQSGEGIEFFLLWIGMALTLVITGGGKHSIDERFFQPKVIK